MASRPGSGMDGDTAEPLDEEYDDLPAFATDANKELHAKTREKEKLLAQTEAELEDTKERIQVMQGHLESVKTEQLHTQRLVDAKIKEIETEDHLKQLAERERGRFHVEFKKLQQELSDCRTGSTACRRQCSRATRRWTSSSCR